jgi:SOS-response transcriptional repressor LexA
LTMAAGTVLPGAASPGCTGGEPFALMALDHSMAPEFAPGDVVVIEPDGRAVDGSFVLACVAGEWLLRRLVRLADGWALEVLDPTQPRTPLADLQPVRGVVIQRVIAGCRRASKSYLPQSARGSRSAFASD